MKRSVFFSFHYLPDGWRASQVRNAGVVEGNQPVADNEWEEITRGGDAAIKSWIDGQVRGRSCAAVLIGSQTAGRKWIKYEIDKAWNDGKGVVGIYIHNLKNRLGNQALKGRNPFDDFTMQRNGTQLSSIAKAYDPAGSTSTAVYVYIKNHIEGWVDEAIHIRKSY